MRHAHYSSLTCTGRILCACIHGSLCTHICKPSQKQLNEWNSKILQCRSQHIKQHTWQLSLSDNIKQNVSLRVASHTLHCNPKTYCWSNLRPDSAALGNQCCSLLWRWQGTRQPPRCTQHQQYFYGTQIYVDRQAISAIQPGQNTVEHRPWCNLFHECSCIMPWWH